MSLWYAGNRNTINLMVASKKVPLQYNLDPTSKLASFIEWYEMFKDFFTSKISLKDRFLSLLEVKLLSFYYSFFNTVNTFKKVI